MTRSVEVDEQTHGLLEFAARLSNMTVGELIARLVAEAKAPPEGARVAASEDLKIYADYEGHRTHAIYNPDTTRIDVISGELSGRSFKTPSAAARAVVANSKPGVSSNRNGWLFWVIDDGSGRFLQTLRR